MKVYTYSEARQSLARLLREAQDGAEIRIRRRDGQEFVVSPTTQVASPLDVDGVDVAISASEIVDIVREVRHR
jgi:hypothetical protein